MNSPTLKATKVVVSISDNIALVHAVQTYEYSISKDTEQQAVECTYCFQLPPEFRDKYTIHGCALETENGKIIINTVAELHAAEDVYNDHIAEGKLSILLNQDPNQDSLFKVLVNRFPIIH